MRQTMHAKWNRFKTFARQQRARLAAALEILGGTRQLRAPRGFSVAGVLAPRSRSHCSP
jgi:hypothetical protein